MLARKWLAKMTKTRQNENENFQTMANRDDSYVIGTVRFVRPHALLGAATGLVAQFRCGLWGWLVNLHSRRGARLCRSHRSPSDR